MTIQDIYMNGEDHHDTIPVRRETLDEVLSCMHECLTGIATIRVELRDYKDRIDSDIRALRAGTTDARSSVADLEGVLAAERLAETKASRDRWRNWIIGIGTNLLVLIAGILVGRLLK